ncbi:MAG: hypothetical protein AAGH78_00650 [Cyanobacteria bacterium P01_H01_bin.58]
MPDLRLSSLHFGARYVATLKFREDLKLADFFPVVMPRFPEEYGDIL